MVDLKIGPGDECIQNTVLLFTVCGVSILKYRESDQSKEGKRWEQIVSGSADDLHIDLHRIWHFSHSKLMSMP